MSKDPAVLFYTGDFLVGVSDMPFLERGYYITLLCMQHQKGHLSEETICFALGLRSVIEIPSVMKHFRKDEDGLYYQRRMEEETSKRLAYTESRRKNGKLGGRPPTKNQNHMDNHMDNHMGTHMGNGNGNGNDNSIKDKRSTLIKTEKDKVFDAFWSAYPRKTAKKDARKAFDKVPRSEWDKLIPAVEEQKVSAQWQKENGRFIPHPTTWLNQGRWEDELPEEQSSNPFLNMMKEERLF